MVEIAFSVNNIEDFFVGVFIERHVMALLRCDSLPHFRYYLFEERMCHELPTCYHVKFENVFASPA